MQQQCSPIAHCKDADSCESRFVVFVSHDEIPVENIYVYVLCMYIYAYIYMTSHQC